MNREDRHRLADPDIHVLVHTRTFSLRLRDGKLHRPERQIGELLKEMVGYLNTGDEKVDNVIVDITAFTRAR